MSDQVPVKKKPVSPFSFFAGMLGGEDEEIDLSAAGDIPPPAALDAMAAGVMPGLLGVSSILDTVTGFFTLPPEESKAKFPEIHAQVEKFGKNASDFISKAVAEGIAKGLAEAKKGAAE